MLDNFLIIALSFFVGFAIPVLSRRFAKFMPADAATTIIMLFHFPRFPNGKTKSHQIKFKELWESLLWGCFLCGIFSALLTYLLLDNLSYNLALGMFCFCMILLLMGFVDGRFHVLPDVLTVPLLIAGFASAYFLNNLSVKDSVLGACFGYLLPTIIGAVIFRKTPRIIGGGDIKLLAALGAWFGIIGLNLLIALSAFLFVLYSLVCRKRSGPYGPFVSLASIIIVLAQIFSDLEIFQIFNF